MGTLNKILHIEDDPDILEIAEMALSIVGGFEVKQADCGERGLQMVEEFSPDLILIDMQMPGMTGAETLHEIRKIDAFSAIPGIFMTAKLLGGDEGELDGPHNLGLIAKPFDPMSLGDEIRALWDAKAS